MLSDLALHFLILSKRRMCIGFASFAMFCFGVPQVRIEARWVLGEVPRLQGRRIERASG